LRIGCHLYGVKERRFRMPCLMRGTCSCTARSARSLATTSGSTAMAVSFLLSISYRRLTCVRTSTKNHEFHERHAHRLLQQRCVGHPPSGDVPTKGSPTTITDSAPHLSQMSNCKHTFSATAPSTFGGGWAAASFRMAASCAP
jgi:hypothetical protein